MSFLNACFWQPPPDAVAAEIRFSSAAPQLLRIGASAKRITPRGLTFLAGATPYRPVLDVHDDLWARAVVLDDGEHRIALISLDLIGLHHDDVLLCRRAVAERIPLDYVLIACTHTHSAPDLIGVWAPLPGDPLADFRRQIAAQVAAAVAEAATAAVPATIRIAAGDSGYPPLTRDTRPPKFIDDALLVWQARAADSEAVIATAVHYASHPILVPSFSFTISSDFPHYLRQALEDGIPDEVPGYGGVAFFFNGALAGRITPANADPGLLVWSEGRFAAARAYGERLARRARALLDEDAAQSLNAPQPLAAANRTVHIPLENPLLRLMTRAGIVKRPLLGDHIATEVAILRIGPLQLFAVPGMIFPELVHGGFSPLPGSDFPDAPAESHVFGALSDSRYMAVIGMANDQISYIIPRVHWDGAPPHITPNGRAPYGELVSPGPSAAQILLDAFAALVGEPRQTRPSK